jgi:hypothetical protein
LITIIVKQHGDNAAQWHSSITLIPSQALISRPTSSSRSAHPDGGGGS